MDPLSDLLTTRRIQTGLEICIEPYLNWQFGCVENPDRQFGKGLVLTWTRTWSDGPEPLLTLLYNVEGTISSHTAQPTLRRTTNPALIRAPIGTYSALDRQTEDAPVSPEPSAHVTIHTDRHFPITHRNHRPLLDTRLDYWLQHHANPGLGTTHIYIMPYSAFMSYTGPPWFILVKNLPSGLKDRASIERH